MKRKDRAMPFVPIELHVGTLVDDRGMLGILSIHTTEGPLDIALDEQTADAMFEAIAFLKASLTTVP
ncbi:hypothetical protein FJ872_11700 [Mesorhizobium sp. B2-5-9]|uniref:hypothetical protein n=1 Tax=Mesorhizobium sp. B2-5-9 TaxID=2589921 RepID=UPI00112AE220|nr:hypothetical protein [Mesorhizobium sp. B2-5-9]TPK20031.1 hypothetical protein FJ872_11700 [Mesorhizobium sp. B2-5-9]